MKELAVEDWTGYINFLKMDSDFHRILVRVGPRIEKQNTF